MPDHFEVLPFQQQQRSPFRTLEHPLAGVVVHADGTQLLEREDLKVIWQPGSLEAMVQCSLPYGLSRADVEAAIQAGP